jgi:hypothetical protein
VALSVAIAMNGAPNTVILRAPKPRLRLNNMPADACW